MAIQNIVTILKINFINFGLFLWKASGICSRLLLISYSIIVVLWTRIFRNLDLGKEWLLRL